MANYVCSDLHGYLELYKKIKKPTRYDTGWGI